MNQIKENLGFKWPAIMAYTIILLMAIVSVILLIFDKINSISETVLFCALLLFVGITVCFITLVFYRIIFKE